MELTKEQIQFIITNLKAIKNMTYKGYTNNERAVYYLTEQMLDNITSSTSN